MFECIAAAHVVLADFSGDFRGLVFEEAAAIPVFSGNQEQASVPLDRDLLLADVGRYVFAGEAFALHQVLGVVPVSLIIGTVGKC